MGLLMGLEALGVGEGAGSHLLGALPAMGGSVREGGGQDVWWGKRGPAWVYFLFFPLLKLSAWPHSRPNTANP